MSNEPGQPVEATSSETGAQASIAIDTLSAKTKPKDNLDNLLQNLNNLILVYISAIYYFDCFSLLLLLRFVAQTQSLVTGVRFILTSNAICLLTHIFHSILQPAPREFWNHGGALVDFVGEKPISRTKLIILDLTVLGLQILYLALHYKRIAVDPTAEPKPMPVQDLDAEEAGISRANPPAPIETDEGIELDDLLSTGRANGVAVSTGLVAHEDNTVTLRRVDFKEVFLKSARNAQPDESTAAVRRFFERVQEVRSRRVAQEPGVMANTTNV